MNGKVRKFDRLIRTFKSKKSEEIPLLYGQIRFTDDELHGVRTDFRGIFAKKSNTATVLKFYTAYEIHYKLDGYNITVVDADLKCAKEKFCNILRTL